MSSAQQTQMLVALSPMGSSAASSSSISSSSWDPSRTSLGGRDEYNQLDAIADGPFRWTLLANAGFTCATFPLIVFLILRRSPPELSFTLRVLMLNCTLTSTLLALWHAMTQFVPLYPHYVGYSNGVFSRVDTGVLVEKVVLGLKVLLSTNLSLVCTFAFLHNYALVNPSWMFHQSFSRCRYTFVFAYGTAFAVNALIVCSYANIIIAPVDTGHVSSLPVDDFERVVFEEEPSLAGISMDWKGKLCQAVISLWMLAQCGLIVLLNVLFVIQIKKMGGELNAELIRMLLMAHRMFVAEAVLFLLFFYLPLGVISLSAAGLIHSYYPALVSIMLMGLNCSVTNVQILLFIRPYRMWLLCILKRAYAVSKFQLRQTSSVVQPMAALVQQ